MRKTVKKRKKEEGKNLSVEGRGRENKKLVFESRENVNFKVIVLNQTGNRGKTRRGRTESSILAWTLRRIAS